MSIGEGRTKGTEEVRPSMSSGRKWLIRRQGVCTEGFDSRVIGGACRVHDSALSSHSLGLKGFKAEPTRLGWQDHLVTGCMWHVHCLVAGMQAEFRANSRPEEFGHLAAECPESRKVTKAAKASCEPRGTRQPGGPGTAFQLVNCHCNGKSSQLPHRAAYVTTVPRSIELFSLIYKR